MNGKVVINLEEFGGKGEIVMSAPTFRRKVEYENLCGMQGRVELNGKELKKAMAGNLKILVLIEFTEKAPFRKDVEPFLKFMDGLEEAGGDPDGLYDRMFEAVDEIKGGKTSPFAGSPAAETGNSE